MAGRPAADVRRDRRRPPIGEALGGLDDGGARAPWAIVIGPEGGFAESELTALRRMKDVMAVGLGPRILRADTAALAALACWQSTRGRLAEADAEIAERLSHVAWRRLESCACPCRYGTGDSKHHEPAAGSREESSCDTAPPTLAGAR